MAAVGAITGGWIASRTGEKKLLVILLSIWVVILPLTALQRTIPFFVVCMVVVGLLSGATAVISRSYMVRLAPPREITHAFSYYAMAERLASFLGPLAWGILTYSFVSQGVVRYQIALAGMAIFVVIGLLLVRTIEEHKPEAA
jgi:MFS-type transporter involved in bile tolerance (Atg22 family)